MANERIPDCARYLMANTAPHLADAISTALQIEGRLSLLSLLDKVHESARESLSPDRIRAIMGTIDDRARESFEAAIRLSYEALGSAFADKSLWDRRRTFATRRILLHNLARNHIARWGLDRGVFFDFPDPIDIGFKGIAMEGLHT